MTAPGRNEGRVAPRKPLVIFDLDGTLLDSAAWLLAAVNQVLAPFVSVSWTVEDLVATAGGAEHHVFARVVPPEALTGVLEAYGHALREPGRLRPHAGAEGVLEQLAARGHRLALFSGAGTALGELRLRHVGWSHRFSPRVWGDQVAAKPAPDGIRRVIEFAGAAAGQAIYVGDTPKDAQAAAAAGVDFVGCAWGDVPGGPACASLAARLEDLLTLID